MPRRRGRNSSGTGSLAAVAELRCLALDRAARKSPPPLPSRTDAATAQPRTTARSRRELFTSNLAAKIWPNARIALPPIVNAEPRPGERGLDAFELLRRPSGENACE